MEFVHRSFTLTDTIAAIATPPGEGGIAIIRISGRDALDVAARIFSGPVKTYATHTAHFGVVRDLLGNKLDEALLLVMRGKRSYTGEDTVEIQCHGGSVAAGSILQAALSAGARAARAGEFTFKAFMNGKLDLAQAEAVQALIGARNEKAFQMAQAQLEGRLSKKIREYQERLVHFAAVIEAWVDFPEEGLEFATLPEMIAGLEEVQQAMEELLHTYHEGRKMHVGITLCISGAPNVGKSSLMNALLAHERAIVTPIAGTTRDLIEEEMLLGNLSFKLIDTAGVRATDDIVEKEGITRAKKAMQQADLVLLVFDASRELVEEEKSLAQEAHREKTIAIWNKIDQPHQVVDLGFEHSVALSASQLIGIKELKHKILSVIKPPEKEEVLLSSSRHKQALEKAHGHLTLVIVGLKNEFSAELLAADMRHALSELGTILGTNVGDDILSSIFSQFCIGK